MSTLATFGNTRNDQHVDVFGGFGSGVSPSAPWEVAASLVGTEALHLANPPELSRPLQTLALPGILPPRDPTTWWTSTERQALSDGIATALLRSMAPARSTAVRESEPIRDPAAGIPGCDPS